jgi:hypothetical protein
MKTLYQDNQLTLDEIGITIQAYYFPLATKKLIPWSRLKSVSAFDVTFWNGKYRIWGMGLKPVWFNCDSDRPEKSKGFALDSGSFIKAAITPNDPEKVRSVFIQRGFLNSG